MYVLRKSERKVGENDDEQVAGEREGGGEVRVGWTSGLRIRFKL